MAEFMGNQVSSICTGKIIVQWTGVVRQQRDHYKITQNDYASYANTRSLRNGFGYSKMKVGIGVCDAISIGAAERRNGRSKSRLVLHDHLGKQPVGRPLRSGPRLR